jgi:hypothetical protein
METVTISKELYKSLLNTMAKMDTLEVNGVDNWVGYECMCEYNTSCYFCAEDEEILDEYIAEKYPELVKVLK